MDGESSTTDRFQITEVEVARWGRARSLSSPEASTCETAEIVNKTEALRARVRAALGEGGADLSALLAEGIVIQSLIAKTEREIQNALKSTLDVIFTMMDGVQDTGSTAQAAETNSSPTSTQELETRSGKKRGPEYSARDHARREAIRAQNAAARRAHSEGGKRSRTEWFREQVAGLVEQARRQSQAPEAVLKGKARDRIARNSRANQVWGK